MRMRDSFGRGRDNSYVRQRLQDARSARAFGGGTSQSWVIKEARSPTGYCVVGPGGKLVGPLYLDTYRGPGFKIDADGHVYYDQGP